MNWFKKFKLKIEFWTWSHLYPLVCPGPLPTIILWHSCWAMWVPNSVILLFASRSTNAGCRSPHFPINLPSQTLVLLVLMSLSFMLHKAVCHFVKISQTHLSILATGHYFGVTGRHKLHLTNTTAVTTFIDYFLFSVGPIPYWNIWMVAARGQEISRHVEIQWRLHI